MLLFLILTKKMNLGFLKLQEINLKPNGGK